MIIENGSDLLLVLNLTDEKGNRIRVNTKNSFTIRVFTAERSNYLEYNKTDIVSTSDNDKLYLNSNELETLESGVIAYTYMYGVGDKNFNDGEYNNQKTVYTDYYFKNSGCSIGTPSNPVDYKVIQQLKDRINDETDRATAVEGSLFNKMEEHQTEVTNRINQEVENSTAKVNTEASERQAADTALQGNIDKLNQTVSSNKTASDKAISDVSTAVKSETTRATAKESALEGKITSLTNTVSSNKTATDKAISDVSTAVKSETTRATAKESSLEGSISTTNSNLDAEIKRAKAAEKVNADAITTLSGTVSSNKTATDKAISDEVARAKKAESDLSGNISTTNTNLNSEITRAKAAEAKALADAKTDAANKYQPKGNYLTSHQDISGKLDKTTASQTYLTKTDASATYQPKGNYLTSHQDISGKVDKVTGKGLSTNDYTTAEKNKLASLPDDFEGACTDAEIEAMLKELGL